MKYRVVGWTYYEDAEVLDSEEKIGFAERNAIIDDIRANNYLFSGWSHQEELYCVPILNDGKKRCFSQRAWADLMAEAHNKEGAYSYVDYTFYGSISSKESIIPNRSFSIEKFVVQKQLNEHFEINVSDRILQYAKDTNPFYLDDMDKLRYIDKNDTLTLKTIEENVTFLIKDINRNDSNTDFINRGLISTDYKIIVTKQEIEPEKLNEIVNINKKTKEPTILLSSVIEGFEMLEDTLEVYIDKTTNEIKTNEEISNEEYINKYLILKASCREIIYQIMRDFVETVYEDDIANELNKIIVNNNAFINFFCKVIDANLIDEWFEFKNLELAKRAQYYLIENNIAYIYDIE